MAGFLNMYNPDTEKYESWPVIRGRGVRSFGYDGKQDKWIVVYTDGTSEIIQGPTLEGGPTGVLPTVELVEIEGGTRLVVTDANGTESADILNGNDGKTPVKGTDYFTESDRQEIAQQAAGLVEKPMIVNPNLLDNWYFGNPVNQRGQTAYTDAGYTIDRWKSISPAPFSVNVDGKLTLNNTAKNSVSYFGYRFETALEGKRVVISVLTPEGLYVGSGVIADNTSRQIRFSVGEHAEMYYQKDADGLRGINFAVNAQKTVDVIAVKLELGAQQTLAHQDASGNWVLNEIPDYGEQLRKCKRFFKSFRGNSEIYNGGYLVLGIGNTSTSGTTAYFYLENEMRAIPTPVQKGNLTVECGGKNYTVTRVDSAANHSEMKYRLAATVSEGGLPTQTFALLKANADTTADIWFDANL